MNQEKCNCWKTCYYGHYRKCYGESIGSDGYICDYLTIEGKPRTVRLGKKLEQGKVVDGKCGFYVSKKQKQKERVWVENVSRKTSGEKRRKVDLKQLAELQKQGLCADELAERTGCTKHQIYDALKKLGLKAERKYSERYHQMYRLYRSGLIDREIAELVGASKNTVRLWRQREGLPSNYKRGGKTE